MHIPAVTSEAISPARLLRQLRETSNDQVPATPPSAEVTLSTDGRLSSLVDRLLAGEGERVDAGTVVRLLGQSALFDEAGAQSGLPPPLSGLVDRASGESLSIAGIGRDGFDATRLAELLQSAPEAAPLLRAVITGNGLDTLFESAANDTAALPASVRLYIDNGGVPGVRLDAARQPDLFAQAPLP